MRNDFPVVKQLPLVLEETGPQVPQTTQTAETERLEETPYSQFLQPWAGQQEQVERMRLVGLAEREPPSVAQFMVQPIHRFQAAGLAEQQRLAGLVAQRIRIQQEVEAVAGLTHQMFQLTLGLVGILGLIRLGEEH